MLVPLLVIQLRSWIHLILVKGQLHVHWTEAESSAGSALEQTQASTSRAPCYEVHSSMQAPNSFTFLVSSRTQVSLWSDSPLTAACAQE